MIPHRLQRLALVSLLLLAPARLVAAPRNSGSLPPPPSPYASLAKISAPASLRSGRHNASTAPQSVRPQTLVGPSLLCAVADADDPVFRSAVSAITGGIVDYFDASSGTPSAAQLANYNCVFTFPNVSYSDRALMGDRLADYVDAGGKVVLGQWCTFTTGSSLGGRIMTSAYSPVTSPSGTNHEAPSSYAGDGFKSLHAGVLAYGATSRDFLVTQGAGIVNGHYADGEISQAYRPDGRVIYSNGSGWSSAVPTGDWPKLMANAVRGNPGQPGMLMAPSDVDDILFRQSIESVTGGVVDYFDASSATPSPALLATYDCVHVWADFPFADMVSYGDELADRVDAGGKVILGEFCTYTGGNFLSGRIMTPDYCPVAAPTGSNHYSSANYAGDGVTSLFAGTGAMGSQYRDILIGQGSGIVDGHYDDGEIFAAYRPDGRVIYLNGINTVNLLGTGDWTRIIGNACNATFQPGHHILYAPTGPDPVAFRAQVAAQTGGVVDYLDPSSTTPSVAQLLNYDCVVMAYVDGYYADRVAMGNNLADYVDAGGRVILGPFTTTLLFPNLSLAGRIMTPAYCPVTSPSGHNHYAYSPYAGDGTSCFHRGILAYSSQYRDSLVLQGAGVADSHYADGEIAVAYRPDRRVMYMNGIGPHLGDTGDWARLLANLCDCGISNDVLYGCNDGGQYFIVNQKTGAGSYAGLLPTSGIAGAGEFECMGPSGVAFVQGAGATHVGQRFHIGNGTPMGGTVADGGTFDGLEWALGRLYGVWMTSFCGSSTFGTLDPLTGISTSIGGTGTSQITGLAFDPRTSTLYGVTGACGGFAKLERIDITTGLVTPLGTTSLAIGSLEFGPDGDLYAGGDGLDGGHLYRISTHNGATQLVGFPGFGGISGLTLAPAGTVAAEPPAPVSLFFSPPYPNPSRKGPVQFAFTLPRAGDVQAELFDVAGRLLWHTSMPGLTPGPHAFSWDGKTSAGPRLGSGIYLMRLVTPVGERSVRFIRLD